MRLFLLSVFLCARLSAQVMLRAGDAAPVAITAEELSRLPRHAAVLSDHGSEAHFEGVLLRDVLARHGVDLSKPLRGSRLAAYVTALASDGYQVVFALAELDPSLTDEQILLVDRRDGAPLKSGEGPYRLVAPQDKRAARSIKMLREVDVVFLRK